MKTIDHERNHQICLNYAELLAILLRVGVMYVELAQDLPDHTLVVCINC